MIRSSSINSFSLFRPAAGLFLALFLFIPLPVAAQNAACSAKNFDAWLDHVSRGRFEAAYSLIAEWQKAPGCKCATPDNRCIEIPAANGANQTVSPVQLDKVISEAQRWSAEAKKRCDPLSGSDSIGAAAWRACMDRQAETLAGIEDPLAKSLLAGPLKKAVAEQDRAPGQEGSETRIIPMTQPSPGSAFAERSTERAKLLASQICEMRRGLMEVEERLENMKRQPRVMRGEYDERMRMQLKLREDLTTAIDKSYKEFKQNAGRDFEASRDCFQHGPDDPKPAD